MFAEEKVLLEDKRRERAHKLALAQCIRGVPTEFEESKPQLRMHGLRLLVMFFLTLLMTRRANYFEPFVPCFVS